MKMVLVEYSFKEESKTQLHSGRRIKSHNLQNIIGIELEYNSFRMSFIYIYTNYICSNIYIYIYLHYERPSFPSKKKKKRPSIACCVIIIKYTHMRAYETDLKLYTRVWNG